MIVAYYESVPDGKIINHNIIPDSWTEEKVEEALRKFNSKENRTCNAVIIKIDDGSFDAYLIDQLLQKRAFPRDSIQEALDALDRARCEIESLEVVDGKGR